MIKNLVVSKLIYVVSCKSQQLYPIVRSLFFFPISQWLIKNLTQWKTHSSLSTHMPVQGKNESAKPKFHFFSLTGYWRDLTYHDFWCSMLPESTMLVTFNELFLNNYNNITKLTKIYNIHSFLWVIFYCAQLFLYSNLKCFNKNTHNRLFLGTTSILVQTGI